ncbi:YopX family protein [Leptotrichia shahii]|jgi:hypothetical protein|nr:YopX family protein [Leptotrichia shahii]
MREIKFRAWLKEERKMVNVETLFIGINRLCFGNSKTEDLFFRDFEEVELMQYTGLKDKNGKEIYEGDIYHVGDKNIRYLVVWFDSGFEGKQLRSTSYAGLKSWAKDIEILGNIYENPELLEENK